jgi:3-oxoacyl-[acyl-carrier-protein] synthase II
MLNAGLTAEKLKEHRTAVILGGASSFPEITDVYKSEYASRYEGTVDPERYMSFSKFHDGFNAAASVAGVLQLRGAVETVSNACASSAFAIGKATELIRSGKYDIVIAGGADSGININTISLFSVLNVMSSDKDTVHSCRPFSKSRKGCVIGEGAGILIIESSSSAAERNIEPLAEITGCASVTDTSHITSPDMTGGSYTKAMSGALESAVCPQKDIDYINAHGTGTYYNDLLETIAIKSVFAEKSKSIPVSSIKAQTGHILSASGVIECIASVMALQKGILPPTMHLDEKDEECDLDYIPDAPRKKNINTVMSNSFGFGGQNTSLILMKG